MKSLINIVLLILITIISACEKGDDITLPNNKADLIATSFISPQNDTVFFKLSLSKPFYYRSDFDSVDYNKVVANFSKNNQNISVSFDKDNDRYYSPNVSVNPGDKFELNINYDDYILHSKCSIPEAPDFTIEHLGSFKKTVVVSLDWTRTVAVHRVKITCNNVQEVSYYRLAFQFVHASSRVSYSHNDDFHEYRQGESKIFMVEGYWVDIFADSIIVDAYNCDKNYYLYQKSVAELPESYDISPFSEPSFVYNNMEGGLGAFGAFNKRNKAVKTN